jgi:hypothetical protein
MSQKIYIKRISYFLFSALCLYFSNRTASANPYYDNNLNIRLAHQDLYALRLASAEKILQAEEYKNPLNGYITFYRLYSEIISLTISNSPEEFSKKVSVLDRYIKTLKELPDGIPDYRMLLGEAYVFTGLLNVKYDNKFSGLINCLKGYNLLEYNAQKYPMFKPDDKVLGVIQIGVAFLPKALHWGAKLLSIESDPQEGLKNLASFSEFARGKPGYQEEAFLFTMTGYRLMNEEDAAIRLIREKMDNFKEIATLNLFAATVCTQANDAETALILLSRIAPEKLEIDFPQLLYMKGICKLMRLDKDSDIPLHKYLHVSSGTDYIKSVLYNLACFYYISGDTTDYVAYTEQIKRRGREFLSRDIEASFEASKPGFPNVYLMRADLLVRGGYFIVAENELSHITYINALSNDEKSLFYFLRGECFRLRDLVWQAESEYLNSALSGKSSGSHIAQKAFVTCGMMMEKNNLKKKAEEYYNSCIHFKTTSNPYSDLYKNKARSGLIRLSLSE